VLTKTRLREHKDYKQNEAERKKQQEELQERNLEVNKERLANNDIGMEDQEKTLKQGTKLCSYTSTNELPKKEVKPGEIYLDRSKDTLLLPICGQHVPFHLFTIKNLSLNTEQNDQYLRINFHVPG